MASNIPLRELMRIQQEELQALGLGVCGKSTFMTTNGDGSAPLSLRNLNAPTGVAQPHGANLQPKDTAIHLKPVALAYPRSSWQTLPQFNKENLFPNPDRDIMADSFDTDAQDEFLMSSVTPNIAGVAAHEAEVIRRLNFSVQSMLTNDS
uniref:Uncharacterized protein n=1 Tax=Eutreptiella gymnastica TaxID=73025 RepID=A0A7S1J0M2_9EUGL